MINNTCVNCIHAEVCGWCDSVTQDVCDFYECDGDWIKADVLQEIRQEIDEHKEQEEPHLCDYRHFRNEGLNIALEIIDSKLTAS